MTPVAGVLLALLGAPGGAWAQADLPPGPPALRAAPPLSLPTPQVLALADGTPVWLLRRPERPITTFVLSLPGGLAQAEDPAALALAAALIEEGVASADGQGMSAAGWAEALEGEGARVKVVASALRTRVEIEALAGREGRALALAVAALSRPALPRAALRVKRRVAAQDARTTWLTPGRLHERAVQLSLYPAGHPLAVRSDARQLARTRRADARRAWQALLERGGRSVVAVGPLAPEALVPLLSAALAPLPAAAGAPAPPVDLPAPASGPLLALFDAPGASRVTVSALLPVGGVGADGQAGLELLSRALVTDFDSRLSRLLREERGWTYGVHGGLRLWPGHGWLELRFTVDPEVLVPALDLVDQELDRLVASPPAGVELARVRAGLRREAARGLWEETELAGSLAARQAWGLGPQAAADELRAALSLPEAELARVAAGLAVDRVAWVLSGDRSRVEPLLEAAGKAPDLVRSGPSAMDGPGRLPL